MKRQSKHNHRHISRTIGICKARAYYSYASFRGESVNERAIEGALLANSATPRVSDFGLEPTPINEGWWYTGVDEERIDQLIDSFINTQ